MAINCKASPTLKQSSSLVGKKNVRKATKKKRKKIKKTRIYIIGSIYTTEVFQTLQHFGELFLKSNREPVHEEENVQT